MKKHGGRKRNGVSGVDSGRRDFLKKLAVVAASVPLAGLCPVLTARAAPGVVTGGMRKRLVFLAIDGFNPDYLWLSTSALKGGKEGDWLMPNLRAFLKDSVWFSNARCHLPAATDMNHLNAVAGTTSAQTGIISVWAQPVGWNDSGRAVIMPTSLLYARDERGRPVDTLFTAWKRMSPGSRTMFVTGKEWVGKMFSSAGAASGVDLVVSGVERPPYLDPPRRSSFADPPTDEDARCDPESSNMGYFGRPMSASDTMTRLYTGQGSLLTKQMEFFPSHFPHDSWIVDSALELFRREDPDVAYILLAQCDDAGHCLGNAPDPDEFVEDQEAPSLPDGCEERPAYRLVSRRNRLLYKEAILDALREVDVQFGRLVKGLGELGVLDDAVVVVLSDHGSVNHLWSPDFSSTDFVGILKDAGILKPRGALDGMDMYAFSVSSYGVLYWRGDKRLVGAAKKVLESHRARNPESGSLECPWWVLDRSDMMHGLEGVCPPGELYHPFYAGPQGEGMVMWPDLFVFAKNGWQIPVYNGHVPNVGIGAPSWAPPWRVYNGGHGSVDTTPILAAVRVPGGRRGVNDRPVLISDLAMTAASLLGVPLEGKKTGRDLAGELS